MLGTIRKFFDFAGVRKSKLQKSIYIQIIKSFFDALQILALAYVLQALISHSVTTTTAIYALGIVLLSMAGNILLNSKARNASIEGSYSMCADHRLKMGDRLKYMPMGYFNTNSLGDITATVTSTMSDVQNIAPRVMENTINGYVHGFIITIMLTVFDWRIGLICVAGFLLFFGANVLMQKKARKGSAARAAAQQSIVGAVLEFAQGISVVRSFNLTKTANQRIDKAIAECEKQNVGLEKAFIPYLFLQSLILKLCSAGMMLAAILFYLSGTMELTNTILMMLASFVVFSKLETGGSFSALMRSMDVYMDQVNEVYKTPLMDEKGKKQNAGNYTIEGRNVCFSYEDKLVLNGVSFTIPQGTTTAIVGPSGGGKTTLANLITRFWDVDSGEITLGGVDVRDYTLDSLLANFSMVFQNVYLFGDTIANNIKFGKTDATQAEVEEAAKKACCHEFIMQLPDGYNTVIGEGGATISGGEKQRISIARAILKDAPIIILDEATANVDPENENQLQAAIEELTHGKTIIMIAHRLKTIKNANQILVVDDGEIVQRGTHGELIQQGGLYADFVKARQTAVGWKLSGVTS